MTCRSAAATTRLARSRCSVLTVIPLAAPATQRGLQARGAVPTCLFAPTGWIGLSTAKLSTFIVCQFLRTVFSYTILRLIWLLVRSTCIVCCWALGHFLSFFSIWIYSLFSAIVDMLGFLVDVSKPGANRDT